VYLLLFAGFALASGYLLWGLWRAAGGKKPMQPVPIPTEAILRERIEQAQEQGVLTHEAQAELSELAQRRESREVYLALFGTISVGKSSLIKALLPEAEIEVDVRGGTTKTVAHYRWPMPDGDTLILSDLPGLQEPEAQRDGVARDEALRAHLVIYVCDGDLTRDQHQELLALRKLGKPMLLALNKIDRYTAAELEIIRQRLNEHAGSDATIEVVAISTGGSREVIRLMPDGSEVPEIRPLPAQLDMLRAAIKRHLAGYAERIHELRDQTMLVLAQTKLVQAQQEHRGQKAQEIVREHTRNAVLGAMAAVAPGSDVLIQGYVGYSLVSKLCALYDVPVREVGIRELLKQISVRAKPSLPIILAIAGNALKAFPGIGTLTGGLAHAVAYGLLFESLGAAIVKTLTQTGQLQQQHTLAYFEESLREQALEFRAGSILKIVLDAHTTRGNQGATRP
jgi:ribosome biogenesis GTPase A